jgi:hypothetical protein
VASTKLGYIAIMKELKPMAELISNHPHQMTIMGGVRGLLEIARTGELNSPEEFLSRTSNHLTEFSNYQSEASGSLAGASSSLGDFVRRNGRKASGQPRTTRLKNKTEKKQVHKKRKTEKVDKICGICQVPGHQKGPYCPIWTAYGPFVCKPDDKTALISRLGEPSLHKFTMCPPAVEEIIKARERSERTVEPWPIDAMHLVMKEAYYDCDVVSHATRFAPNPMHGNHMNNIIGVQFLLSHGGENHQGAGGRTIFYYRVHEVQDLISSKIKAKKLLFNKLTKA